MSVWQKVLFSVVLLCLSVVAWSQSSLEAAQDFGRVERFPGAEIVDFRTPGITNYPLALARMQRVNGRVSAAREERVLGELTRITYRIPDAYPAREVFNYYADQMLAAGPELFRCQGRGCGSSNFWANDVFGNRILYGPEAEQFYLASSVTNGNGAITAYVALYVITRGNRSVYAHLDVLELEEQVSEAPSTTPEALELNLRQTGSVVLHGLRFDAEDRLVDEGGVALLTSMLRNAPLLKIYVVGHLSAEQELQVLLARSLARAQSVVEQLLAQGIVGQRVLAQGVGPLAPACRQAPCAERIEIVLQR